MSVADVVDRASFSFFSDQNKRRHAIANVDKVPLRRERSYREMIGLAAFDGRNVLAKIRDCVACLAGADDGKGADMDRSHSENFGEDAAKVPLAHLTDPVRTCRQKRHLLLEGLRLFGCAAVFGA